MKKPNSKYHKWLKSILEEFSKENKDKLIKCNNSLKLISGKHRRKNMIEYNPDYIFTFKTGKKSFGYSFCNLKLSLNKFKASEISLSFKFNLNSPFFTLFSIKQSLISSIKGSILRKYSSPTFICPEIVVWLGRFEFKSLIALEENPFK